MKFINTIIVACIHALNKKILTGSSLNFQSIFKNLW